MTTIWPYGVTMRGTEAIAFRACTQHGNHNNNMLLDRALRDTDRALRCLECSVLLEIWAIGDEVRDLMRTLEEHEEEQARTTAEWEARAAPYAPRPTTELATHYYVTLTWDDWPEGGSYGTIVLADSAEDAERAARWEMANARDEFEHPADCIEAWGHDWHLVDCWRVDDFIAQHDQKETS